MATSDKQKEAERLQVLGGYEILDTPPDAAFDRITALAAQFFKVPISLVSLVDDERVWFKSRHGLDVIQIPHLPGLCAQAMFSDQAYIVNNALTDPRTRQNPLVTGEMGLRFYAAAPLVTHDGYRLGTVNIIDYSPRDFDEAERSALLHFGELVMDRLEVRLSAIKVIKSLSTVFKEVSHLDHLLTVCAWTKKIRIDGQWLTFEEFLVERLGLSVTHGIHPEALESLRAELVQNSVG